MDADFVLIETLWNVKNVNVFVLKFLKSVLIETLWNVKYEFPPESLSLLRY